MKCNFTKAISVGKPLLAVLVIFGAMLLLMKVISAAGVTQSNEAQPRIQENSVRPQVRKLVNLVPKHLSLKVKTKNFQNQKWVRDLEVEVTNTADKPIYFLEFFSVMTDVKSPNGNPVGIPLRYGRIELIDYGTPLQSDDVPIQPGETYTFKTPETSVIGWERNKTQQRRPEPMRVELIFVQLNFGDGTGFHRTDGSPVPRRTFNSSTS